MDTKVFAADPILSDLKDLLGLRQFVWSFWTIAAVKASRPGDQHKRRLSFKTGTDIVISVIATFSSKDAYVSPDLRNKNGLF